MTQSLIRATALSLAIGAISFGASAQSAPSPDSVERVLPALSKALANGAERSCAPTHLTVTGPETPSGGRFFASAPISQFATVARQSARPGQKLSREQSHALDAFLKAANQAQRTGSGMPDSSVMEMAERSGLKIEAQLLCLSSERISAQATRMRSGHRGR